MRTGKVQSITEILQELGRLTNPPDETEDNNIGMYAES